MDFIKSIAIVVIPLIVSPLMALFTASRTRKAEEKQKKADEDKKTEKICSSLDEIKTSVEALKTSVESGKRTDKYLLKDKLRWYHKRFYEELGCISAKDYEIYCDLYSQYHDVLGGNGLIEKEHEDMKTIKICE